MKRPGAVLTIFWLFFLAAFSTQATETFRERLHERLQRRLEQHTSQDSMADELGGGRDMGCAEWAKKVRRLEKLAARKNPGPIPNLANVAYGSAAQDLIDVFFPPPRASRPAPILVMVHGGGWCVGDKGNAHITMEKVGRWVPMGFLFVSVNYPMVAEGVDALAQAHHVARAVAYVQAHASEWGGDPNRVILMGHSAGAHLVSLINADAHVREANGVRPPLGTVSLDAGAIDVVRQMPNVYPFLKTRYREAFGTRETQWIAASPFHALDRTASPWLGVCSTLRKDQPCDQAQAYAEKSRHLGIRAEVLPEAKGHGALNAELGIPGRYTNDVEAFMASLDPGVAERLNRASPSP